VYTRGEPVESVAKAVTRIGMAQIRQAVMNISVVESLSAGRTGDCLDVAAFWEHSIATGLIGAAITRCLGGSADGVDLAFTMGLIHDVGRLVYSDMLGGLYTRVTKTAAAMRLPLDEVESRMLLINHADAMDRILHKWRFPHELINPVAFHHLDLDGIRHMARTTFTEVATLALADKLAHALLLGGSGNDLVFPIGAFAEALGIASDDMLRIEAQTPEETDDMKLALLCHMDHRTWRRTDQVLRERFTRPFFPLTVSTRAAFDPVRMFCQRLAERGANEAPNVAVAYLSAGRDRAALSDALLAAEREAQVEPLPLVLVSNTGQADLDPAAMRGRRAVRLAMPMPIELFIQTVNELMSGAAAQMRQEVA
jgi:hypothetical protein